MLKLSQTGTTIAVENDHYEAAIHTEGYVSGVAGGTFIDKKTGTNDHSFGLDIVDFLLEPALQFAKLEAEMGIQATYYFLASAPYDLFSVAGGKIATQIAELGHEIGLHYDLEVYPIDPAEARAQLMAEISA